MKRLMTILVCATGLGSLGASAQTVAPAAGCCNGSDACCRDCGCCGPAGCDCDACGCCECGAGAGSCSTK